MHLTKAASDIDRYAGHQLKFLRKDRGLTQAELGKLLGITFQQVQKYEKGQNRISVGRLAELSDTLNVPVETFFPPRYHANSALRRALLNVLQGQA